jgi:hypothetical protein
MSKKKVNEKPKPKEHKQKMDGLNISFEEAMKQLSNQKK